MASYLSEASSIAPLLAVSAGLGLTFLLFKSRRNEVPKNTIGNAPYPPVIPSMIPFLGSAVEFGQGIAAFIEKHSALLENSPIVTATIAGKNMHLVADPAAFPSAFRYSEANLSMVPVIQDFSKSFFGMTPSGLESFDRKGIRTLMEHMLHPAGLSDVTNTIQRAFKNHLNSIDTSKSHDLHTFINQTMFRGVLETIISKSVSNEMFIEAYEAFEKAMPLAMVGLPMKIFANSSYKAREAITRLLIDENLELSSYLKDRRDLLREKGMTIVDVARDNLLWTWGSVSNFIPALFWYLYFVANIEDAVLAIRKEVQALIAKSDRSTDETILFTTDELDNMKALDSTFKETLRVTLRFPITRQVMKDMEIDLRLKYKPSKYFLKEGDHIMLFMPILHEDPAIYPNPKEYQWDRFMHPGHSYTTANGEQIVDPFRPFGGGAHFCPGRKFAVNAAKSFLANLLWKYNVKITGTTEPDMARDGIGVLHPKDPVELLLQDRFPKSPEIMKR